MQNTEYWNYEGAEKIFTHPVCPEWIACLDRKASVLDLGCGYGRLTPVLRDEGFSTIFGYDSSAPMIRRAVRENPGATYTASAAPLFGKTFDLILCFALFTSCPAAGEQSALVSLINGFSQDSTWLYISDYETRDNPNYRLRYEQRMLGIYGCFSSGKAVFRHHEPGHFDKLLPGWKRREEKALNSRTLNGNPIKVHQYLYAKGRG